MKKLLCFLGVMVLVFSLAGPVNADTMADFVFMIDATGSMGNEINAVKNGLGDFVTGLDAAEVDYRFSIVLFGGAPELVLDWTDNAAATETAFDTISVYGAVSGFQRNHNVNPEAGLEAIRIVLGEADDSTLRRDNVGGTGGLDFRAEARKNLILVTDEDSDRPYYLDNRIAGQATLDPPTLLNGKLRDAWQTEVDNTAQAVIDNDAFVNMIINPNDTPVKWQYGDPNQDASDADFLNFDADATLANLIAAGYGDSLEAQVLEADLIARAFNIGAINTPNFVNNFFAAKIEEVVNNPPPPPVPEPATMLLLGSGLIGLAGFRRKFRKK